MATLETFASHFTRFAHEYGLKPEDLGKQITVLDGEQAKIVGLRRRNKPCPILLEFESPRGKPIHLSLPLLEIKEALGVDLSTDPISDEDMAQFFEMAGDLSPENLTCDGECTHTEVKKRYKEITDRWVSLEAKVGRKVTEDEAWKWWEVNRESK